MSVIISDVAPRTQAIATNLQTVFTAGWTADVGTDVKVYARGTGVAADDAAQLIAAVDYTVAFIGATRTVEVTFLVGRTLDDIVTLTRETPTDRQNLYTNTNFTPSMLNQDFEITTLTEQQNKLYRDDIGPRYNVSESLNLENSTLYPNATATTDLILPLLGPEETWVKSADASEMVAAAFPAAGAAPKDETYIVQTADAGIPNAQAMGSLASGVSVSTATTGVQLTRVLTGTSNEIDIANGDGIAANPTFSIPNNPQMPGVEGMKLPTGSTAQRPGAPYAGQERFNSDLSALEYWTGSMWDQLGGGVVDTISGTANQIDVNSADPLNPIALLSSTIDTPGTFTVSSSTVIDSIIDDDSMVTAAANNVPTSESVVAYVGASSITPLNLQKNTYVYDVDTGVADAYVVTLSPVPAAYTAGLYCIMSALNDNTGASTININGLGVIPIVTQDGVALKSQAIKATGIYYLIVDNSTTCAVLINPNELAVIAEEFYIGSTLYEASSVVTSDGAATLTLTFQNEPTGDVTLFFSTGVYTLDCTPALTVNLTAGTDISPTFNYVYILESTKALTVSTSNWPLAEHVPVATALCQSAPSVLAQGLYSFHSWHDNVQGGTDDNGHLGDMNYWIRSQNATWQSGTSAGTTVGVATFDLAVTTGIILQLHPHAYPAFDTAVSSFVLVPNDSVTAYVSITDLATILTDANGVSMSNKRYNLVVWGNISEDTGDCQLYVNLPVASYNSDANCIDDVDNTAVYTIPGDFKGTGFLISRLSMRHVSSGNTFSELQNEDLRGLIPATAAGGGVGGISAVVDDPSPQLGGDLDTNGFNIVGSTGNRLSFPGTGDANENIEIQAGAIRAIGAYANPSIYLQSGGVSPVSILQRDSTLGGRLSLRESSGSGTKSIGFRSPHVVTTTYNMIYPPAGPAAYSSLIATSAAATFDLEWSSDSTDAIQLPVGTTAQRPTASDGLIRYNSSNDAIEAGSSTGPAWGANYTMNTDNAIVDASGLTRLKFGGGGSNAAHVQLEGSVFSMQGSSANLSMQFHAKGTGGIRFKTDSASTTGAAILLYEPPTAGTSYFSWKANAAMSGNIVNIMPAVGPTAAGTFLATDSTGVTLANQYTNTMDTAVLLPVGTTAQEPTASAGLIRYDSTIGALTVADGANFNAVGGGGGDWELISTQTASSDSSIDFTDLSSTYYTYILILSAVVPASNDVAIEIQTSADNGSTFDSTATNYYWALDVNNSVPASLNRGSESATAIRMSDTGSNNGLGNASNEEYCAEISIINPSEAKYTRLIINAGYTNASGRSCIVTSSGMRRSAAAVDAVRVKMSTGNIASGTFKLYGIKA